MLDGIAVTAGPGLVGSLVIGVASAKALAFASGKPLYAVNHLHGHLFAPFIETGIEPEYPFLALLVSGGHSQLVHVASPTDLRIVARTRDDAAGEAFDKTARLLGLPFPGGPEIDRLARSGDPKAIAFPRHRAEKGALDMSFSGIKTAVKYFLDTPEGKAAKTADVAASFQAAVVDVLIDRLDRATALAPYRAAVLSGGVAANSALQTAFLAWSERSGIPGHVPHRRFCTDNAAMIAAAADRQGAAVARRRTNARGESEPPVRPPALHSRLTSPLWKLWANYCMRCRSRTVHGVCGAYPRSPEPDRRARRSR